MYAEQNNVASEVVKRFRRHTKKTAFVVDHNNMLATDLADRVIVFEETPSIVCTADSPHFFSTGVNLFLSASRSCFSYGQNVFIKWTPHLFGSSCQLVEISTSHFFCSTWTSHVGKTQSLFSC